MKFTIEQKEAFKIMGLLGYEDKNTVREGDMTGVWVEFMADMDKLEQNPLNQRMAGAE